MPNHSNRCTTRVPRNAKQPQSMPSIKNVKNFESFLGIHVQRNWSNSTIAQECWKPTILAHVISIQTCTTKVPKMLCTHKECSLQRMPKFWVLSQNPSTKEQECYHNGSTILHKNEAKLPSHVTWIQKMHYKGSQECYVSRKNGLYKECQNFKPYLSVYLQRNKNVLTIAQCCI